MQPLLDPEFDRVVARLPSIRWASHAGHPLPPDLASRCSPVGTAADALASLESDDWEAWSAERQNTVTAFLRRQNPRRFADWNPIAQRAKELLASHLPAIAAGLAAVGLSEKVAVDTVEWDLIAALTTAAFLDCKPPVGELRLLEVYEAGHLPVGWDATHKRVLVF